MKRLLSLSLIFALFACKKEQGEAADTEAPMIAMTSPTNNQSFAAGQTVSITGRITDNVTIEEVHLEITNKTTGGFITHEHFVPDSAGYSLARTFTLPSAAVYRIKVEAEDAKRNNSEVEMNVSVN